jgi:hypothetical protein
MLGYEPSMVVAEFAIADCSKCARDMGLSAGDFLDHHNPMFAAGEDLLRPYTTPLESFSNQSCQILLVKFPERAPVASSLRGSPEARVPWG